MPNATRTPNRARAERAWIAQRKHVLDTTFRNYGTVTGMHRKQQQRVRSTVRAVTPGEFERALAKCQVWLREHVRGRRPYALLLGSSSSASGMNSSQWLARHVMSWEALGPPDMTLRDDGTLKAQAARAADMGVKAIVHLNDALYSGNQLYEMLEEMENTRIPVFIAVAYSTPTAISLIAGTGRAEGAIFRGRGKLRLHPDSRFYAASKIADTPHTAGYTYDAASGRYKANSAREALRGTSDVGATMTLLPHKVPNTMSFGMIRRGHTLSNYVTHAVGKAPYHPYHPHTLTIQLPWEYTPNRYSSRATDAHRAWARTAGHRL